MSALTFDTLKSAERLIASGFTEKQAKAVTETVKDAQDAHLEELSTKGDIALVRKDMEIGFTELRGKITLVQWMLAAIIAAQVLPLLKMFFGSGT